MALSNIFCILLIALVNLAAGKMVDMTHMINSSSPCFGECFRMKSVMHGIYPEFGGWWWEANEVAFNEHTGTHIDAPVHTNNSGGEHTNEIPLKNLVGPAIVIDIKEKTRANIDYVVTVKDLLEFEEKHGRIPEGAFVFLDTDGAKDYWNLPVYEGGGGSYKDWHFPGFGWESVEWLCDERNINGIGNDRRSFGPGQFGNWETHATLLSRGKIGIENANNVNKLPSVGATVFVMPLPFQGGSGSPSRIVAFWDTDLPVYSSSNLPCFSRILTSIFIFFITLCLVPA